MFEFVTGLIQPNFKAEIILTEREEGRRTKERKRKDRKKEEGRRKERKKRRKRERRKERERRKSHWVLVNLLKVFGEVISDFKTYTLNVCVKFFKRQPLLK